MTMTLRNWAGLARRAVLAIVLVGTVSAGLSGCHHLAPPVGLGPCYESLPLAEGALDVAKTSYVFHGVELVSPKDMAQLVKRRFPHNPSANYNPPLGAKVCAFAFTGTFPADQVAGAPAGVSGKAAIVLTTTDRKLLFSFVLAKLPVNFSRPFTGA
ncbi:MAG: hypothetical protein ABSE77_14040 [Acidimicrobiales bacterium]|jgi:hypothetical protein